MRRPILVEIVAVSPSSARIRSSHRITPGLDVSVHLTTADAVIVVIGAITRCHVVPLPRGQVGYDATVTFPHPIDVSVTSGGVVQGTPRLDLVMLTGVAPHSTDELIAMLGANAS
jgi:hypothetical protein